MITSCIVGAAFALAGCQDAPSGAAPQPSVGPSAGAQPPAAAAQQWAMPNLVGTNLQAAQDQIQALTGGAVFFTSSHDATQRGRNQVVDANWTVCSQNVATGAPITSASRIDFGAVKVDESCP
jgi:hypothetical protein